jgi:predicted Fe-S protein YdhL (DUF1289 family)
MDPASRRSGPPPRGTSAADEMASPCISVCVLLEPQGICAGCFRTLDEIAQWSLLDAQGKRAVLAALPARRAAMLGGEGPPTADGDAER